MFKKILLSLTLIYITFVMSSCAVPIYHFDSGEEWKDRKEAAFLNAKAPWMPSNNNQQLLYPSFMVKYLGYEDNRITFENVQRLDYFNGYIYIRRKPETIGFWAKYIPLGIFSFEAYGVIGSNKEWISRPSIEAFSFQLGFMAVSAWGGLGLILPTRVWAEEAFHASQEILHPTFTEVSGNIMYWLTLKPVPVAREILATAFYFLHPMEIDAKIKKWVYAGWIWNLDCDAAWNRYNSLLVFVAKTRCEEEGEKYFFYDLYTAYLGLVNNYSVDNNIYRKALQYKGLSVRVPYETKMVYSPWIHGVMREEKELPLFTRTFIVPVFGEVGYK